MFGEEYGHNHDLYNTFTKYSVQGLYEMFDSMLSCLKKSAVSAWHIY